LQSQKHYEEALQAYEKAIALEPEYADPWNGKGNVLQSQGRHEEALKAFEKAIALMTSKGITS
jgi:tetratricopeptide (TPR) repeat protein